MKNQADKLQSPSGPGSGTGDVGGAKKRRHQAAIVLHYFPHYRSAVMHKLAESTEHDYCFLADLTDPHRFGIKGSTITEHPRFHRLKTWRLWKVFFHPGLLAWALGRKVDTLVITSVPYCLSYWIVPLIARARGKRVIFWTIGWIHDERGPKNWLRVIFNSLANSMLLYGHNAKQLALQRGFRADRMHVVYNSLDYAEQCKAREQVTPEVIRQTRQELFAELERPLLVCCSRLQAHRQLNLVIEAMGILKKQGRPANLLLIGDGPELERLRAQGREADVDVHFFGACYDETVLARLIMASDLTVAPGMVGLTAMQSLAYGTPVLTHDDIFNQSPESDSLEPGVTGQLFRYRDVDDLALKIREWFERPVDREETRKKCFSIIERFYNPDFQVRVVNRAVSGLPADDIFWMRENPPE